MVSMSSLRLLDFDGIFRVMEKPITIYNSIKSQAINQCVISMFIFFVNFKHNIYYRIFIKSIYFIINWQSFFLSVKTRIVCTQKKYMFYY